MTTALITGGSKGIGLGIAEAMAQAHMKVAITSRHLEEANVAAKRLLDAGAEDAIGIVSDARDWAQQQNSIQQIMDRWGQLDVVVANAGVGHFASIEVIPHEQWHEIIDTNLTGVFYTLQASIEALKKSKDILSPLPAWQARISLRMALHTMQANLV